jgi:Leucine-rich repeat (LRR) protein
VRTLIFPFLLLIAAYAEHRVVLKNGSVIAGEKVSENINFIVLNVDGSEISLLKNLIEDIESVETPAAADTADTAGPAPQHAVVRNTTRRDGEKKGARVARKEDKSGNAAAGARRPRLHELMRTPDKAHVIDLSFEDLDTLPHGICRFSRLRRLDLKGNHLSKLPPEIGDLTGLVELDLRFNRLRSLPPQLSNITGLRVLYLTGNKIPRNELSQLRALLPFTRIVDSHFPFVRTRKHRPRRMRYGDVLRADSLAQRCEKGHIQACHDLGVLCQNYNDNEKAILAFGKGCTMEPGDTSAAAYGSCMKAADINFYMLRNREKALEQYRHVCKYLADPAGDACERYHDAMRRR